jgi:hypothetical protein
MDIYGHAIDRQLLSFLFNSSIRMSILAGGLKTSPSPVAVDGDP